MAERPPDPLYVFRGDMNVVSCLTFGPKEVIYAGTQDGLLHVWDLKTNRKKCSFKAGDSTCLSINAYGKNLITQTKGGLIRVWLVNGPKYSILQELDISYFGFCRIELFTVLSQLCMFAPCENSVIKIVNMEKLNIVDSLFTSAFKLGELMAMKHSTFSQDPVLFAGYESGHILLWDVHKREHTTYIKFDATPMAIDFDCEKKLGLCGTESENVFLFAVNDSNSLITLKTFTITNPGVSSIRIRGDKKLFVLGCWDGHIRVFSWKTLRLLAVLTAHSESLHDLCFSTEAVPTWKCNYLLAAASKDKSISLWSIYDS